jgi:dTDP-4-dehydrorhamnose reductase
MMKKILVTGCNGQLGRAIRQEYKGEDVSFINTDVAEGEGIVALDITDVNAVLALVRAERPDVIINCAAHTNVRTAVGCRIPDQCDRTEKFKYCSKRSRSKNDPRFHRLCI